MEISTSNAFIIPVTYFFYPETAYRSLEEMDTIFHKTTSVFDVVKVARELPRRFGKNGELLIDYNDTEEAAAHGGARRRSSAGAGATGGAHGSGAGFGISNVGDKVRTKNVENVDTPSGGGESSVDEKGVEK